MDGCQSLKRCPMFLIKVHTKSFSCVLSLIIFMHRFPLKEQEPLFVLLASWCFSAALHCPLFVSVTLYIHDPYFHIFLRNLLRVLLSAWLHFRLKVRDLLHCRMPLTRSSTNCSEWKQSQVSALHYNHIYVVCALFLALLITDVIYFKKWKICGFRGNLFSASPPLPLPRALRQLWRERSGWRHRLHCHGPGLPCRLLRLHDLQHQAAWKALLCCGEEGVLWALLYCKQLPFF